MKETEDKLARRIIDVLNDGDSRVEPAVQERLAAARRMALAHYREERAPTWALVSAGAGGAPGPALQVPGMRLLLVAGALVCAVALGWTWHAQNQSDIAEIDAGLLSDELPINAYLDRGFDSWLKRVSR